MLSIIICSINPANFEAQQRQYARLLGDAHPFEIIGVHDAKSLCEGYNRGVAHARPDSTHFIFAHDDIEILSDDFLPKLARDLARYDLVGVAGSTRCVGPLWSFAGPPHLYGQIAHLKPPPLSVLDVEIFGAPARSVGGIQVMDGLFLAASRRVVEQIRWDEQTFDGWHMYDLDFTFRAHLAGFRLGVACDIAVIHASIGETNDAWAKYAKRFQEKHARQFAPFPRAEFMVALVRTRGRPEALAVMTPPWWPPFPPPPQEQPQPPTG